MTAELTRKRQQIDRRQARLNGRLREAKALLMDKAASSGVLVVAFSSGFLMHRLWRYKASQPSAEGGNGESESVSPTANRLAILIGVLLSTAIRRSLWGFFADVTRSAERSEPPDSTAA